MSEEQTYTSTIRIRMSASDAHYGGFLVNGAHMLSLFGDVAIVLKRELLWIPCYGWYARKAGMVPIDRGAGATALKAMVRRAREVVAEHRPIVIFPEGTRTAVGAKRPYHPGVAALYLQRHPQAAPADGKAAMVAAATRDAVKNAGDAPPLLLRLVGNP